MNLKKEILEKSGFSINEETVEKFKIESVSSKKAEDGTTNLVTSISFNLPSLTPEEAEEMVKKEGTIQRMYEALIYSTEAYKKYKKRT